MQLNRMENLAWQEETRWGILGLVCLFLLRRDSDVIRTQHDLQNFFWTAFVNLNATAYSGRAFPPRDTDVPFVRLAPQRMIGGADARSVLGPHRFSINANRYPGRHQELAGQERNFSLSRP